ncbi:MAG: hypothetical protein QM811_27290 [Pirellulales bacterium]
MIVVISGCDEGKKSSDDRSANPALNDRLKAAIELSDPINRDQALTKVAVDAAAFGDIATVKNALSQTADKITKDNTTWTCVDTLCKSEQYASDGIGEIDRRSCQA